MDVSRKSRWRLRGLLLRGQRRKRRLWERWLRERRLWERRLREQQLWEQHWRVRQRLRERRLRLRGRPSRGRRKKWWWQKRRPQAVGFWRLAAATLKGPRHPEPAVTKQGARADRACHVSYRVLKPWGGRREGA